MIEGTVTIRVRYAETDQMGVVYHSNYLVWCELGRTELMRQLGYPYAAVEKAGLTLAVADASIRYVKGARYDDEVVVTTGIEAVQSRTVTFRYAMHRRDEAATTLLATASTRLIALDPNGAPRRLPPELLERFREISSPA